MKDRIIADTHFLHDREVKAWARKKWYEYKIIKHRKNLIKNIDTVYVVWDIACGKDLEVHQKFIMQLPGFKILIKGNHDNKTDSWYIDHGRDMVVESLIIKRFWKEILLKHIPDDFSTSRVKSAHNRAVIHWHYHAHANHTELAKVNHVIYSCEHEDMQPRTIAYMLNLLASHKKPPLVLDIMQTTPEAYVYLSDNQNKK